MWHWILHSLSSLSGNKHHLQQTTIPTGCFFQFCRISKPFEYYQQLQKLSFSGGETCLVLPVFIKSSLNLVTNLSLQAFRKVDSSSTHQCIFCFVMHHLSLYNVANNRLIFVTFPCPFMPGHENNKPLVSYQIATLVSQAIWG